MKNQKKMVLPNNQSVSIDENRRTNFTIVIPAHNLIGRHIDVVNDVISFKATGDENLLEDISYDITGVTVVNNWSCRSMPCLLKILIRRFIPNHTVSKPLMKADTQQRIMRSVIEAIARDCSLSPCNEAQLKKNSDRLAAQAKKMDHALRAVSNSTLGGKYA
jgi:hypothetical protein